MKKLLLLMGTAFAASGLTGCIMVGHSTGGGWFVWPGGLGLLVIVLLAIFLLRGRR